MSNVLIVDDEPGIRTVLSDIIRDENHNVLSASDGFDGLKILKEKSIDLVILDVWLPNMGGIDVLKEIKKEYQDIEVIMISGHANIDIAVKAVKLGAFDFLEKPLSLDKIINLIKNALKLEELKKENTKLKNSLFLEDKMIGSSDQMKAIWNRIIQSAPSDAKIMISGANGTGKELIAREIHKNSLRANGPFIEVNCAAIPDTLIESELFGHEKGAFTSAIAKRKGKFELAHNGTLFLDEIADMSLNAQAKVLRVIQELKFERIGSEKSISVDIRLITATNKDIAEEVKAGRFREDLFYRLNVVPIHAPSLIDRISDLKELIQYFMEKFQSPNNELCKTISKAGLELLKKYTWPGNIRELKNFIERINIMSDEEEISIETVKYYLKETVTQVTATKNNEYSDMKLNDAKDEFEKQFIIQKLEQSDYNISRAAETLGIYPSNLHGKIKKLGIEILK